MNARARVCYCVHPCARVCVCKSLSQLEPHVNSRSLIPFLLAYPYRISLSAHSAFNSFWMRMLGPKIRRRRYELGDSGLPFCVKMVSLIQFQIDGALALMR